jgi:glycosyltransferase involved in cell wall biosynthesis
MIEEIPKISVLIIAYKQEDLIKRTLNSLLSQKDYIYEICVSDDCSPDGTWNVLKDYDRMYPGLFKLHRNSTNLGIFENIEIVWTMPTGEIVYLLAGDDECGDSWFKTVTEYIKNTGIDYKNELFCIYGDYKSVYPNGDTLTHSNKYATSGKDRLRLYERGYLSNRSCCYSINVMKQFKKISCGRSYIVENAQDSQLHFFSERAYYIPKVGNIYYANLGVSSKMYSKDIFEHENTMVYAFEFFKSLGIEIHPKDKNLPHYNIAKKRFYNKKSIGNLLHLVRCYMNIFDLEFIFIANDFKRVLFSLIRRFPHTKPICW